MTTENLATIIVEAAGLHDSEELAFQGLTALDHWLPGNKERVILIRYEQPTTMQDFVHYEFDQPGPVAMDVGRGRVLITTRGPHAREALARALVLYERSIKSAGIHAYRAGGGQGYSCGSLHQLDAWLQSGRGYAVSTISFRWALDAGTGDFTHKINDGMYKAAVVYQGDRVLRIFTYEDRVREALTAALDWCDANIVAVTPAAGESAPGDSRA